jgi:hypothetical protein
MNTSSGHRLGQHWFITASIAVYRQGLYTVYNGAGVRSTVAVLVLATEYTECWPCPLFDILHNKYFPGGYPSGR